ncbi:hypothetical protein [Dokdonella sp.]|uniref:hypothetical protein n=1 Tax=Dokdonella sp. TaxID=2291710 RepID=UPI002F3E6613
MSSRLLGHVLLATLCGLGGCALKTYVVDESQIDSLTYCTVDGPHVPGTDENRGWGRVHGKDGRVLWSHYALGTFACRTQDEWVCQARTGRKDCAATSLEQQLADAAAADKAHPGIALRARNETQSEMLLQADRLCDRYLASVFGEQAGNSLWMDVLGTTLSGGATLASGNSARNLSAGAALLGATKSHINADVYQNQIASAINLLIRKKRNAARSVIHNNQGCSVARYPAADAVTDALVYHNMCSFEYGLGELVHEASDTSPVRGSVATLTLQRLQKQLAELEAHPAAAGDAAAKARYEAALADLRSQIRVYEGFGITAPASAPAAPVVVPAPAAAPVPAVPGGATPPLAAQRATSNGDGDCSPLPVVPLSG